MPNKKKAARTPASVKVNPDALDYFKHVKGLDDKTLAKSARVSIRTIERARSGLGIRAYTVDRIAKQLDVPIYKLLFEPGKHGIDQQLMNTLADIFKNRGRVTFKIECDLDIKDFSPTSDIWPLCFSLIQMGYIKDGFTRISAGTGSIILLLDLSHFDVWRIERAFKDRSLSSLRIKRLKTFANPNLTINDIPLRHPVKNAFLSGPLVPTSLIESQARYLSTLGKPSPPVVPKKANPPLPKTKEYLEFLESQAKVEERSNELDAKIREFAGTLRSREKEIFELSHGLLDGYTYTPQEIARVFKLTPEGVEKINKRATHKLIDFLMEHQFSLQSHK